MMINASPVTLAGGAKPVHKQPLLPMNQAQQDKGIAVGTILFAVICTHANAHGEPQPSANHST